MRLIDADLLKDVPMFNGIYDKGHANEHFIHGIATMMEFIGHLDTIDLETLPIVQELREKLARYERLEAEGRIKILPKGKKGTCGGFQHFHRISGTQRGTCDIKEQRVDRWGNPHKGWGRFEPGQSKPACKQYKDTEGLER